ncbi:hypothetical protein ACFO4E_10325 [Nocardiopsis mangrovi]|uniref:Uncharacterized protein n=1 Tax=Nocardiopsis mangrovi TaxID=1179818 RepID=A0ABV9DU87_9ACTN
MWWCQGGADDYREWITAAGLVVAEEGFAPEGAGGHAVFWARR